MSTRNALPSSSLGAGASPPFEWPAIDAAPWLGAAALPALSLAGSWFAFWTAWHRGCVQAQRELVDQWIVRFGGGAPLDG